MISKGHFDGHTHGPPPQWPLEQSCDAPHLQGGLEQAGSRQAEAAVHAHHSPWQGKAMN